MSAPLHDLSPMSSMTSLHGGGDLSHSSSRQSWNHHDSQQQHQQQADSDDAGATHSRQASANRKQHRAPSSSSHRSGSSRSSRRADASASAAVPAVDSSAAAAAAPFDFQSSTLHLLDQQDRLSRGFHEPSVTGQMARQQQFVAGIAAARAGPTQFSAPPSGAVDASDEQDPERVVAAAAAHVAWRSAAPAVAVASQQPHRARSSHSPGSSRRPPQQPARTAAPDSTAADGHHSSFLIQDRIHFFERYAVQPSVARPGGSGELAAVGTSTNPRSGAPQQQHHATGVPINDAGAYTRGTSTHTRHATTTTSSSSDPAHGYGSHLGSASGSYTDRDAPQRKVLAGSGAPPSVARMEKSLRKHGSSSSSAKPRSSPTTHVGFGSSQIKETASSLADKLARRNTESMNATTHSTVAPLGGTAAELARVYNPNTLAGKAERFTALIGAPPGSAAAGAGGPSRSQKQFGVGHELPPFLAPDTAQRLEEASRQARVESVHTRAAAAAGSGGAHFDPSSASAAFPAPHSQTHAMGGFVVEGPLSDRWRHTKPSGSSAFRAQASGFDSAAESASAGDSISMADHIRLVNEALSAKTVELLAIYRAKLAREAAHLDSDYYFSSSAARQDLQRVIATYHSKLSAVSSQFDSLSSLRQRAHKLKLSNASLRVFNLDMARNYDAELGDMKLEVDMMQQMSAASEQNQMSTGEEGANADRPSTGPHASSASYHTNPLTQIAFLEGHIASKESERRALEKTLAATRREIEEHRPKLEAALQSTFDSSSDLSSKLSRFAAQKEQDYTAQRTQIAELQQSIAARIQSNTTLQIQVEALRKQGGALAAKQAATEAQLAAARASYEAEVSKGVSALHALQAELSTKSHALSAQFRLIQDATELLAGIDDHLRVDLTCRACLNVLRNPRILWPCGHTICEGCIQREESCDAITGAKSVHLVCAECKTAFDHPAHSSSAGHGAGHAHGHGHGYGHARSASTASSASAASTVADDDESHLFPNPFFDPPPNWDRRFYAAENKVVDKILAAHTASSDRLRSMLPHYESLSHSVDLFRDYLMASGPAATHKLIQQAEVISAE